MASKINATDRMKDSFDIIVDLLSGAGVESFIVTFDGSGDDGQLEGASEFKPFDSAPKANKLLGESVKGARVSNGMRYGPNGPEEILRNDPTLDDLISNFCYETLEQVSPGWEINEGSHGTFIFDLKKRKMNLDFNERVVQDNHFDFVL